MNHIELLSFLVTCIVPIALGIFVFREGDRTPARTWIFVFFISVVGWSIANLFSLNPRLDLPTRFVAIRFTMCAAVWQSVSFFFFVLNNRHSRIRFYSVLFWVTCIFSLVTSVLCFSSFVFTAIHVVNNNIVLNAGPAMWLFIINSTGFLLASVGIMFIMLRDKADIFRMKFMYLAIGFIATFALIIFFDFVCVTVYQIDAFVSFAGLFFIPLMVAMSVVMVTHRLLDIEFSVHKKVLTVLVNVILFSFTMVLLSLVKFFSTTVFFVCSTSILLSAVLIRRAFINFLNTKLFFDHLNSAHVVLGSVHEENFLPYIKEINNHLEKYLKNMHVEYIKVFVLLRERSVFMSVYETKEEHMPVQHPVVIASLFLNQKIISIDQLSQRRGVYTEELLAFMRKIKVNTLCVLRDQGVAHSLVFLRTGINANLNSIEEVIAGFSGELQAVMSYKESVFGLRNSL